jgi:phosphoribosylaminoimidazole-succinocarboxamide synthase
MDVITETSLSLPSYKRGKVRDTYELEENLLMVSTDRLSAFDVVFNEGIPYKGIVLNELSLFWFNEMRNIVKNHLVTADIPSSLPSFLNRRSMVVVKAKPVLIECVVRGYLSGSALSEYNKKGSVCGIRLPSGLLNSSRLPEPIFTPSTKAETGHDVNITEGEAKKIVGKDRAEELKEHSLRIYEKASDMARKRGIILADTKFEFGEYDGEIILIDELLTPDSSRYWPVDGYEEGKNQRSFDKQYVRDYLEGIGWNKEPPPPTLPPVVIRNTSDRYIEAYERLTGKKFKR